MIEECLVVEFAVTGDDCPLATATRETDTAVEAKPPQRRADGNALLQFSGDPAIASVLDADERIRYLHASTTDDRVNYRCLSKHPCVVHQLTDAGFMAEALRYDDGIETYTGAVVGYDVLEGVLEAAGEAVGVTLERIYPLGSEDDEAVARRWGFTPAQEEALRLANEMGYFEVPRRADAGDVAAELGIGKSAFLERLRRGQAALMAQVFE
ncbi:helix-turn-helix domain-containing protein [Haloarchaeobius litoreus]|uniref:Helix-turn-helix domain-containing protein n=1 Tax=Haloarchaeobius litoreus TaxID=755306 RepID=A0ABD6DJB1_9EURY|nr:helix-turn-helix domain-containing protein [Haloarchaeobius litoreus]